MSPEGTGRGLLAPVATWWRRATTPRGRQPKRAGLHPAFPGNVRLAMVWIVLSAVVPLLLLQAGVYSFWAYTRRHAELEANLDLAWAVSKTIESHLRDLYRQEWAIGKAIQHAGKDSPARMNAILDENARLYHGAYIWGWTDPKGHVVGASDRRAIGLFIGDRQYFREILSGQPWAVSDALMERLKHGPAYVVARRIEDEHGKLQGAVLAVAEIDHLMKLILPKSPPEDDLVTLYDRHGLLIFSHPHYEGENRNWRDNDALLDATLRKGTSQVGSLRSPIKGDLRWAARVPMSSAGWVVGISRPIATVMAPIVTSLWIVGTLNLAVVGLSLVAARIISRKVTLPLSHLREHVRAIAGGNLDQRVHISGVDELTELGENFNVMAGQLQERHDEVDRMLVDLNRSNRELEQFAYIASHDLQEPLRVISGYLQLIERRYKDKLDADADQFVAYIVDAAQRMQQLISDLLQYSRVGSQGKPLAPTDVEAVLVRVLASLERVIEESGAQVTHDPLPVVLADEMQLARLLQNLLANAIKFHADRRPEIHLGAERLGTRWRFSVRDNGIGIEPQYWEQIFRIFQRLHTRKKYAGTGIGLAICKRIVERHGGEIGLDSKPGEGSTFYFTLAAVEPEETPRSSQPAVRVEYTI